MAKKLNFDIEVLEKINHGVVNLARAVKVTLGPKGRTVILYRGIGAPHVTKDGVTVAKDVEFEDSTSNMAALLVREVASKTADLAGDGTTTSIVLVEALFRAGYLKLIDNPKWYSLSGKKSRSSVNAMDLVRGMVKAKEDVEVILNNIKTEIKSPNDILNIATISANNDKELGELISKAYGILGNDAVILKEESPYLDPLSKLKLIEGIQFDKGYMSPSFTNDSLNSVVEYDDPMFLLIPGKSTNYKELLRSLEISLEKNRALVIIAEDFDTPVLEFLVTNKFRAKAKVVAIKAPGMGEQKYQRLKDLSALTGCRTLDPSIGSSLSSITEKQMGSALKVVVKANSTTIVSSKDHSKLVYERVLEISKELSSDEISNHHKDSLDKRVAQLKGKLAMIQVGAITEAEVKEKKDRLDDAIEATKSAVQEGYIVGSGLALYRASEYLSCASMEVNKDFKIGYNIVKDAIKEPMINILTNGGLDAESIINRLNENLPFNDSPGDNIERFSYGYNSLTDKFTNLLEDGVIDPVKVTRLALSNAVSISSLLLTTGCSISLN